MMPPQQPMMQPQQQMMQPAMASPQPGGGFNQQMNQLASHIPQSKPGTLFGVPYAILHDNAFLTKVLLVSAAALLGAIIIPYSRTVVHFMGEKHAMMTWAWTKGLPKFRFLIWPIIVGGVYGFIAAAPADLKKDIPPPVLKWTPFFVAYFSVGLYCAAVPLGYLASMMGGAGHLGAGVSMMAWGMPLLTFGMIAHMQDEEDMVANIMVGIGGVMTLIGTILSLKGVFHFKGFDGKFSITLFLHNIIWLIVSLACAASVVFAIPRKVAPGLAAVRPFAPVATALLVVWPPIGLILATLMFSVQMHSVLNLLFMIFHGLLFQVAFLLVLYLTAPAAFDVLKNLLRKAGVQGV
jgi:hypothetical protein